MTTTTATGRTVTTSSAIPNRATLMAVAAAGFIGYAVLFLVRNITDSVLELGIGGAGWTYWITAAIPRRRNSARTLGYIPCHIPSGTHGRAGWSPSYPPRRPRALLAPAEPGV